MDPLKSSKESKELKEPQLLETLLACLATVGADNEGLRGVMVGRSAASITWLLGPDDFPMMVVDVTDTFPKYQLEEVICRSVERNGYECLQNHLQCNIPARKKLGSFIVSKIMRYPASLRSQAFNRNAGALQEQLELVADELMSVMTVRHEISRKLQELGPRHCRKTPDDSQSLWHQFNVNRERLDVLRRQRGLLQQRLKALLTIRSLILDLKDSPPLAVPPIQRAKPAMRLKLTARKSWNDS
eukprot:CAMPEP_0176001434 /NCGR_PEP_ID=MMETSP0120_2-20121206/120_1 /TAXON_ID=160619 /ORGANISM="Kryptoperidinium foliaceum, Strain CCMP 1326" /LENGTH=242 /DNA_ID=CAMNT_0017333973 /DNA_START=266 /DNA_END=994 /DNA_ORIENTATION=-